MTTAAFERELVLFQELHRRVDIAGLFKPTHLFYVLDAMFCLSLLAACMLALTKAPEAAIWSASSAVFTAMVKTRLSYIAHDAGHKEVFPGDAREQRKNVGVLVALTFVLGISGQWWTGAHDAHHLHPNHVLKDPNLRVWILAFSDSQRGLKGSIMRFVVRFQFLYYPIVVALEIFLMRIYSIYYIVTRSSKTWREEGVGMIFYFATHIYFLAHFLGWEQTAVFLIVQEVFLGIFLGSVFAPNHKGMRVIEEGEEVSFLEEQLTTTRNVKPNPVVDFIMGGLNYQVEHHLFPMVPRVRLRKLREIVKAFCQEYNLYYYEVSIFQSYWEILKSLFWSGNGHQKTIPYEWEPLAA